MTYYEKQLLAIAPWTEDFLQVAKTYNHGAFNRPRTGWDIRGINKGESIYEHSLKVALAGYFLLGTKDAIDIGIIHDIEELIDEDHIPGTITKAEKRRRGLQAMHSLKDQLPDGDYWFERWQIYQEGIAEGAVIKELDKICPVIEAVNLRDIYTNHRLEEFYPAARRKVQTPQLVELLEYMWNTRHPLELDAYDIYFDKLQEITL